MRLQLIAALMMAWSCGSTTPLPQTPTTLAITDVSTASGTVTVRGVLTLAPDAFGPWTVSTDPAGDAAAPTGTADEIAGPSEAVASEGRGGQVAEVGGDPPEEKP
jgi:hypothetical protein